METSSSSPTSAVAVAASQTDHLSELPNELLLSILSLLPTHIAARTSVLSRRFRHLWEASPSLDLVSLSRRKYNMCDSFHDCRNFFDMAACAFLCRDPVLSLPSLRLVFPAFIPDEYDQFTSSCVTVFLHMAHPHGLRHLTIENSYSVLRIAPVIFRIFSIDTLTSLSLDRFPDPHILQQFDLLSGITLTHLTSLSLCMYTTDLPFLDQLLSRFSSLQDFQLSLYHLFTSRSYLNYSFTFAFSSRTINKIKLIVLADDENFTFASSLSLPSLESLNLVCQERYNIVFHGDFPLLKTAVITLNVLRAYNVPGVVSVFTCISHVEELSLHVQEYWDTKHQTVTLLRAAEVASEFPNLKNLDATLCFHEHNIRAIIKILTKSPAIKSLKLDPQDPELTEIIGLMRGRKISDWETKLPHNTEGIYHKNLHLGQNKKELINFLSEMCISKKAQN